MSILRSCTSELAAALADKTVQLSMADFYKITLLDGTVYHWTNWDVDLTWSLHTYTHMNLKRGKWNLTNSMTVPSMDLTIYSAGEAFDGSNSIKWQVTNGLFDGAVILHSQAFMQAPPTIIGVMDLNAWIAGEAEIGSTTVALTLKGKNNRLNANAPRNLYQAGCLHAFCDDGCTLARASYTTSHVVGSGTPTQTYIPWDTAPSDYAKYQYGTVKFTSGDASGQSATVTSVSSSGLTLAYPLIEAPAAGDSFTAFKGCAKTKTACTAYSNIQHWRAFPYTPQVESGV